MPYTGSGVLGSALGMDKLRTKQIWQSAGIPTPDFALLENEEEVAARRNSLHYPVIVKPAHEGSSIGISKVERASGLLQAWQAAARFDRSVLVEQWVDGAEYTTGILGETALPLIRRPIRAGRAQVGAKRLAQIVHAALRPHPYLQRPQAGITAFQVQRRVHGAARQGAAHRPQLTTQRELASEFPAFEFGRADLAAGGEDAQGNWQVEAAGVLGQVGRGQVDGPGLCRMHKRVR